MTTGRPSRVRPRAITCPAKRRWATTRTCTAGPAPGRWSRPDRGLHRRCFGVVRHLWSLFWVCLGVMVLSVPAGRLIGIMNDTVLAGDPSLQVGQEGRVAGDYRFGVNPGVAVGATTQGKFQPHHLAEHWPVVASPHWPDLSGPALCCPSIGRPGGLTSRSYFMPPWPGTSVPPGCHVRRRGHQLRAVLRGGREGRALPVRRATAPRPGSSSPRWTGSSSTATCPTSSPASSTATASTGRTTRPRGCAATRTSCCSTRTPRPSTATSTGTSRCSATRSAQPDERNDDDSAPHMCKGVVINPFFDWAGDRPPRIPYNETVIYEAHVKGLTICTRTCPRSSAGPTRASPTRPSSST